LVTFVSAMSTWLAWVASLKVRSKETTETLSSPAALRRVVLFCSLP